MCLAEGRWEGSPWVHWKKRSTKHFSISASALEVKAVVLDCAVGSSWDATANASRSGVSIGRCCIC